MSALRCGVAQREFTPPVGIMSGIWGAAKKFRSESIHIGLFLTAVAREDKSGTKSFIVGIDLCVFPDAHRFPIDELFIETQPAHLQKGAQTQKMSSEERDALRATIIRAKLLQVPQPDIDRLKIPTSATNEKK